MLAYSDLTWTLEDYYRATYRDWVFYSYQFAGHWRVIAYIADLSQPIELCEAPTQERAFTELQVALWERFGVELHSGSSSSSSATSGAPSSNV